MASAAVPFEDTRSVADPLVPWDPTLACHCALRAAASAGRNWVAPMAMTARAAIAGARRRDASRAEGANQWCERETEQSGASFVPRLRSTAHVAIAPGSNST